MRSKATLARALLLTALAAVIPVILAGCNDPHGASGAGSPPPTLPDGLGSISVELHLGTSITLASVSYDITRPGFDRSGSLDVSSSTTVSGVIGDLPVATGYAINMSASDVGGQLAGCQGASTFDVTAGAVTPVAVHLTCREKATIITPPPPVGVPVPPFVPLVLALAVIVLGARSLRKSVRRGTPQ